MNDYTSTKIQRYCEAVCGLMWNKTCSKRYKHQLDATITVY